MKTCRASFLESYDAAIAADHVSWPAAQGAIALPSNWSTLGNPERQFVMANLTRQAYGLPLYYAMNPSLNANAQTGANAGSDASWGPNAQQFGNEVTAAGQNEVSAIGGYWSSDTSVLVSFFSLMYEDGCGGPWGYVGWLNLDCAANNYDYNSGGPSWGHRDAILGNYTSPPTSVITGYYGAAIGNGITAEGYFVSGTPQQLNPYISVAFKWSQELPYLPACEQGATNTCTLYPPCPVNQYTGVVTQSPFCSSPPTAPVVGMATTNGGGGYYEVAANGAVWAFGNATFYGSMAGHFLAKPIVGMAVTPDNLGYWLVASDGGIFAFGDAKFYGSMGGKPLNKPIVGIAAIPTGGYYEVASDGGIFSFGATPTSAPFYGSMGGKPLNKPVVGITTTPGGGYYEVASDGGLFAFGPGTPFLGSMGGKPLNQPVVGMTEVGGGYYEVASDGGLFSFGSGAMFHGSMGGQTLNKPVVGMTATSGSGYYEVASDGGLFSFGSGAPFLGAATNPPVLTVPAAGPN
ncbi:MAG: hypothetical protein M1134_02780 [Actinobacteria bacterium]|nr:hypothetical protein [Actinomycetota bacterium]